MNILTILACLMFVHSACALEGKTDSEKVYVEFDVPPTIWLTADERKILFNRHREDIQEAFEPLQQRADAALDKQPSPLPRIVYEGHVSNHPERIRSAKHLQDMLDLRALIWAYVMTKDKQYADKAKSFLLAWTQAYKPTGNDVNDNKLNICIYAYDVLKDFLNEQQQELVTNWIAELGKQQKDKWTGKGSSNRHGKRLKMIIMASLVVDRPAWQPFIMRKVNEILNGALYPDGTTRDLHRRDAMHYNVSCIKNILKIAHLLRVKNINIYEQKTESGASLKKCVAYVLPYIRGEKVHAEWVNTKVNLDRRRWESGDPYYKPGKPWDPMEGYDMLVMASYFEPSLDSMVKTLRQQKENSNPTWVDVLVDISKEG